MAEQSIWVAWKYDEYDKPQIVGLATSELAARRIAMVEIETRPKISKIPLNTAGLYEEIVKGEVGIEPPAPVTPPKKRTRKPKAAPVETSVPVETPPLPETLEPVEEAFKAGITLTEEQVEQLRPEELGPYYADGMVPKRFVPVTFS